MTFGEAAVSRPPETTKAVDLRTLQGARSEVDGRQEHKRTSLLSAGGEL